MTTDELTGQPAHRSCDSYERGSTITPRAVILGTLAAVAINIWVPFSAYSAHSSRLIFSYLPMATLLPFVVIVLPANRSEEHTSELQSRVDISYAVFCLKKKSNFNFFPASGKSP